MEKTGVGKCASGIFAVILAIIIPVTAMSLSSDTLCITAALGFALSSPRSASVLAREYLDNTGKGGTYKTADIAIDKPAKMSGSEEPAAFEIPDNITDIDPDIAEHIAQAKKTSSDDREDGKIKEYFYDKQSATDTLGNILIRNNTDSLNPDFASLLGKKLDLKVNKDTPAVLIFHTHTTEGYETLDRDFYAANTVTRTTDTGKNIVRVGTELEETLCAAGFKVIHDTRLYDLTYSGAYDRSRATVEEYLKKYPEIKIVLDVHRDAIHGNDGVKTKPTAVINGKKAAQIMIISGAEGGAVTGFPNWEQNLGFALNLQKSAATLFPGLMRPIFFCHRMYNMDLTPCSLLLEFGSDANTLDEAVYSARLVGTALVDILNEYTTEANG